MGNLGNPQSIASCHYDFTKYEPSCKSCRYNKVISENMGHPEPKNIVIIKKCPKLPRVYGTPTMGMVRQRELSSQILALTREPPGLQKVASDLGLGGDFRRVPSFLHYLQLASNELARFGINVTKKRISRFTVTGYRCN